MRRKKVCFVGYGSTEYSRKSEASALSYYAEAIRAALKQTGLDKKEIRGFRLPPRPVPTIHRTWQSNWDWKSTGF